MPELPEVEVVRRGLVPHLVGRRIEKIRFSNRRLRLPVPRKCLLKNAINNRVEAVDRRAKYLLLRLENGTVMVIHLGMTGRLGIFEQSSPGLAHDHVCWLLDDGHEMRFNDSRRFGSIQFFASSDEVKNSLNKTGPEPLGPGFTEEYLFGLSRRKKQPIKNFLMNSHNVAGIGNIYASELLFHAGIRPQRAAGRLSRKECARLVLATRQVLAEAISCGGSTIADFVSSSGKPGYFQLKFRVYGRDGSPCRCCCTPVRKIVLAGRATFYCPVCQG